jgi:hypothetical protein
LFGGNIAAGTRAVLNDERLPEPLGQPQARQAREDVAAPAGSEANDQAYRARWIGLRVRKPRGRGKRDSTGRQMQKPTAW